MVKRCIRPHTSTQQFPTAIILHTLVAISTQIVFIYERNAYRCTLFQSGRLRTNWSKLSHKTPYRRSQKFLKKHSVLDLQSSNNDFWRQSVVVSLRRSFKAYDSKNWCTMTNFWRRNSKSAKNTPEDCSLEISFEAASKSGHLIRYLKTIPYKAPVQKRLQKLVFTNRFLLRINLTLTFHAKVSKKLSLNKLLSHIWRDRRPHENYYSSSAKHKIHRNLPKLTHTRNM